MAGENQRTARGGPEGTRIMSRWLGHLSCQHRLSEFGVFNLEKRFQGDCRAVFQYVKHIEYVSIQDCGEGIFDKVME